MSTAETRYMAGYEAGRAACLRTGSLDSTRHWIDEHPKTDSAYLAGLEWAMYDDADANAIPYPRASNV